MKELPVRKKIRCKGYDYSKEGCYFVTICIKDKHLLLGEIAGTTASDHPHTKLSELGNYVSSAITYYSANNLIYIDKYVIMPNHIHLIIVVQPEANNQGQSSLYHIVRNFKSYVTKKAGFSPWQKSFHDRIIRNEMEYQHIWQYIDENPARWTTDEYFM